MNKSSSILFENLFHGSSYPDLRLLQAKQSRNGGSTVKLHHTLVKQTTFADIITSNNKRRLHLHHRFWNSWQHS